MSHTYTAISRAEDMVDAYEDASASIRHAIEALRSVNDGTADGFAADLEDILTDIRQDNEQYQEVVDESIREEEQAQLRDYWASVL